jgi:hypothetical protein
MTEIKITKRENDKLTQISLFLCNILPNNTIIPMILALEREGEKLVISI